MTQQLKKDIDNVVWWIPFKKTRNSFRNILINFFNNKVIDNKVIDNKVIDNKVIDNKNYIYSCPICGWSGDRFKDWSASYRNVICPKCGSHPRHRLFYFYLLNKINLYEHLKVCHFAPEQSVKSMFQMFNNIEYLSCDIIPGRAMHVQDITNITFEDNSFDIVFCSHVLEHVPDDIKAMKELKRILKDNGYAIIVVPLYDRHSINGKYKGEKLLTTYEDFSITDPEKRSIEFGQWDHVRKYEKNDFINRLKISGFNVIEENLYDKLNKNITKKYGIYNNDIIFCCIKK